VNVDGEALRAAAAKRDEGLRYQQRLVKNLNYRVADERRAQSRRLTSASAATQAGSQDCLRSPATLKSG